jgi:hypothetical protein
VGLRKSAQPLTFTLAIMLIAGGIFVCLLSFFATFIWARLKRLLAALLGALIFPYCVAWVTYWLPVVNVADKSEYDTWFLVVAIIWLIFALPISIASTLLIRRALRKRADRVG